MSGYRVTAYEQEARGREQLVAVALRPRHYLRLVAELGGFFDSDFVASRQQTSRVIGSSSIGWTLRKPLPAGPQRGVTGVSSNICQLSGSVVTCYLTPM